MKEDNSQENFEKCLRLLDENLDILNDIEQELSDEQEDKLTSDIQLHHLYDMAEDISEFSKIKKAESSFMRRQMDNFDS